MNLLKLSFLTLPILLVVTACTGVKTTDELEQVKKYEAAHNAFDVEGTMALFAQDAEFELAGQGALPNLEAIRGIHGYDKAIRAQVNFQNCVVESLTVTCQAVEQNDWLKAAGLGEIYYPSSVFTFNEAGQIQKVVAAVSPEDSAAMGAVLAEFIPWLLAERPKESRQLFTPEGVFIYSEANGILVVDQLTQWRGEAN
jgi:hypothetical protein